MPGRDYPLCLCPWCEPVERLCVECQEAPGDERGTGWVLCTECEAQLLADRAVDDALALNTL